MIEDPSQSDNRELAERFHYVPELNRTLQFFSSFAVAFSFISVTTGVFASYGLVLQTSGPVGIWMWPVVTVGHFLVALVFAELAGKIPLSGYSYQWVSRLTNRGFGWFTGWLALCYLTIVLPTVNYACAPLVAQLLGLPDTTQSLAVLVICLLVVQAAINIYGVKLAARINNAAVYTEVFGVAGMILAIGTVALLHEPDYSLLTRSTAGTNEFSWSAFLMAGLMGSYTLVGFEAAADMAEETIDPTRNIPRAILLAVALSGIVGMLFVLALTLGISDLAATASAASPIPVILQMRLGSTATTLFLLLVVISVFACALIIMAAGSRLIYAMARDGMFFCAPIFSKVSSSAAVPMNAILFVVCMGVVAVIFSESLTLLVGATAVLPALIYLCTVVAYALRAHALPQSNTFTLGKWRYPVVYLAILWLLMELAMLTVPTEFHKVALMVGALLISGALVYWSIFRRRAGKLAARSL